MPKADTNYEVIKILLETVENRLRGYAYYNSEVDTLEDILDQIRITLQFCRIPVKK